MDSHNLAKHFFYCRDKWGGFRVGQTGEGDLCGSKAAEERAAVVGLWERNLLVGGEGTPEGIGVGGLGDACWGEEGVEPGHVAITIFGSPITLLVVRKCMLRGRRKTYIPCFGTV
jgi:hypothetical protein